MRILTAELRKTFTLRFFLVLLIAVAANFLLFRHNLSGSYSFYGQEAYVALQKEVIAMGDEGYDYMKEQVALLNACMDWETYESWLQQGYTMEITEEMLKYQEVYEKGEYLRFTDNLYPERSLHNAVYRLMQQAQDHKLTLQSAIDDAKTKTSFAIFAKPGTFAYRSQLATIERLEGLLYIQPAFDISDGVLNSQVSAVTDLLGLMLILFLCTELVVTEQKNGMLPILRATKKGRLPLIASKALAAIVLALFVVIALWGMNAVYCGFAFGFGDLSRPVQSLNGFTTSTLEMSVGSYMLLFFAAKWVLYATVGILCLAVGLVFQGAMPTWLTIGGFLSVEYILVKTIPAISAWNMLKYVNISNLIFDLDWLSQYRNLDFFGYPVDVLTVSCVLLVLALVGSIVLLCWLFCRRQVSIALPKLKLSWPKWLPRPGKSTALFGHEMWKLMIECGAVLILVLLLVLNLQEPRYVYYSADDLYYKNYMENLQGPLTEKTDQYLTGEEERFAKIEEELRQISKLVAAGEISSEEASQLKRPLEAQLEAKKTLQQKVYPRVERAKQMVAEGKDAWIVYEVGYEYLLGLSQYHDKTGAAAMLMAGIILCFANFYPMETTSGMLPLLNVYKRGRGNTARCKLGITALLTVLMFVITQIPDYWYLLRNYGFPLLNAPLCSLEAFTGWSDGVSILGGILIFEGLRLMTALSVMAIVMAVCLWTKNQIVTMSASAGVILLPLLLHLLDITFLNQVSFYLPLNGAGLLAYQESAGKALLYYGIVLILGAGSSFLLFRYVFCGYRFKPLMTSK